MILLLQAIYSTRFLTCNSASVSWLVTDGLGLLGRGAGTGREGDGLALIDKLLRPLELSGPAFVTLFPGDNDLHTRESKID